MGIAHAKKSLSGEIRDTVRVVGNAAHLLDKVHLRKATALIPGFSSLKLAQKKLMFALIFRAVVIGGNHDADADHLGRPVE